MLRTALVICTLVAAGGVFSLSNTTRPAAAGNRVPVVVELFTSEGCSSCPAADDALRQLETDQSVDGIEVLALGEHVDYWNRLGWKDPFSSAAFTARQREYAAAFNTNSYTPQAVVDGGTELVGSRQWALVKAIEQAAKAPRATVQLTRAGANLKVRVGQLPAGTGASTVLLAFTESGLSSQVGRGENSGRLLHHAAVVRELQTLGNLGPNGTFTAAPALALNPQWKVAHLKAVVLVQENASRHIVGVASLPLSAQEAAVN
ncbi:DUF1223 domain-containing protein [Hymenobacter taeanensis]|uniref:DUF1223 domain-containing protein n=1 Tax=Hymenobacter taeanensis TaxID=2735321 RepID=A0A6M6BGU4_9BACT|nr:MULTISPECIES: DUF1223 domain-containing protein [Hymenobacter]QJX47457.1 DUF1223 domain-containing protein [Hymenobacter taeanensis]UOQ83059.1 DUF1223 domain-containing protein [Hymenobacter sp. 5414T-23]